MNRETDPSPRSLLVLTTSLELSRIADRLTHLVSRPDPAVINATAQQLREIADTLDDRNAFKKTVKLRSV